MGSAVRGTPNWIRVSGSPVSKFNLKEPCFDPHPGGLGARMNYAPLMLYLTALWLLCLVSLVWDAKSKKPEHRTNGAQATRCTNQDR